MKKSKEYILFVTANEFERQVLLSHNSDFKIIQEKVTSQEKNDTNFYNIGSFCGLNAVHIHLLQQGSLGADASQSAISRAIRNFNIKLVILVGICFGIENQKFNFNDVLVSGNIVDYNHAAIKGNQFEWRGHKIPAGRLLLSAISNFATDWDYSVNGHQVKYEIGDILSGEKLIKSTNTKDTLYALFPRSIGGEMEAAGAIEACRENDINEFIVVKGISDWGDEDKNDIYQKSAATAAVSLLKHVFSKSQVKSQLLKKFPNIELATLINPDVDSVNLIDLYKFSLNSFQEDINSKMVQANETDPEKTTPELAKVFIDLSARLDKNGTHFNIFDTILDLGNKKWDTNSEENEDSCSIRSIKAKNNITSNKLLIKGTAGQGKSTISQFIAQFYRAKFIEYYCKIIIKRATPSAVRDFLKRIKFTSANFRWRIPLCIKLKEYAAWVIKRKESNSHTDILTYLATKIDFFSQSDFSTIKLRKLFENKYLAWLIAFDGLDEVPTTANRTEIMSKIQSFIETEMSLNDADVIYISTTRPDSYTGEFGKLGFMSSEINQLTIEEGINYVERYYKSIPMPDAPTRNKCIEIYKNIAYNKAYRNLTTTPLNVTIIALLIRSEGELPHNQFSLYDGYFNTIVKREKNKDSSYTLREYEREIKIIYREFGFKLQEVSASPNKASTTISEEDLNAIIINALKDKFETQNEEFKKVIEEIKNVIVERLAFVIQNENGYFFRIRSIQEYLAAKYIEDTFEVSDKLKFVERMAKNPYWHNTLRLFMEYLHDKNSPTVNTILNSTLKELNAENDDYEKKSFLRMIHLGSQIAYDWLSTNIFYNHISNENNLIGYVVSLFDTFPTNQTLRQLNGFSDHAKKQLVCRISEKIKHGIKNSTIIKFAVILGYHFNYNELIEDLDNANVSTIEILQTYYDIYDTYNNEKISNLLKKSIKNGEILDIKFDDIIRLIENNNDDSEEFRINLFKNCIRSSSIDNTYIYYDKRSKETQIIKRYFGFNYIEIFKEAFYDANDDLLKYNGRLTIYRDRKFNYAKKNSENFEAFLSFLQYSNLTFIISIFNCLTHGDIDSFIKFYIEYNSNNEVIKKLNLKYLISRRTLFWNLISNINLTFEEYKQRVETYPLNKKLPQDLADFISYSDRYFISPYELKLSCPPPTSNFVFLELYDTYKALYGDKITKAFIESFEFICFVEFNKLLNEKDKNSKLIKAYQTRAEELLCYGQQLLKNATLWHIRLAILVHYRNKKYDLNFDGLNLTDMLFEIKFTISNNREGILYTEHSKILQQCIKNLLLKGNISSNNFKVACQLLKEGNGFNEIIGSKINIDESIKNEFSELINSVSKKLMINQSNITESMRQLLLNIISPIPKHHSEYAQKTIIDIMDYCKNNNEEKTGRHCEKVILSIIEQTLN